jgi:hypothetical protein
MSDNINNTDNITTDPIIDNTGCCIDPDTNIKIYNCTISDDLRFISGYTEEGQKARYSYKDKKWYYGHDIAKLYLIPFNQLDPEKHKEYSIKGGTKTQEILQEKKSLNDIAKNMLSAVLSESQVDEILGDAVNLIGEDRSAGAVMIAKMIQTACAGSFKAAEFVRDTAGYKPETRSSLDISADIMTDADRSLLEKIERRIG